MHEARLPPAVEVPSRTYEELRVEDHRFAIYPGHEQLDEERVLGGDASYLIVSQSSARLGEPLPATG